MKNIFKLIITILIIFAIPSYGICQTASDIRMLKSKGISAYKEQKYQEAVKYLVSIPDEKQDYTTVLLLANSFECLGNSKAAIILLENQDKKDKKNYRAFYNLGNIYQKEKYYRDSIEAYQRSIKLRGNFPEAYYNLSISYFKIGEYQKAAKILEQGIKFSPKNIKNYYYNLGVCLETAGKAKEAKKYFELAE
ncbi:MAG: tetratricopeptide repeat protein [Candidatus Gastranaerophilales bacterium]|nr:tetratricopeptide repeat protein [Candidatus Gastranaerophilales bacterium]